MVWSGSGSGREETGTAGRYGASLQSRQAHHVATIKPGLLEGTTDKTVSVKVKRGRKGQS